VVSSDEFGPVECLDFSLDLSQELPGALKDLAPVISAVICEPDAYRVARQYWQHTGDGISSRRAEFCHALFRERLLIPLCRGHAPVCSVPSAIDGAHSEGPGPTCEPQLKSVRGPRRYLRFPAISKALISEPIVATVGMIPRQMAADITHLDEAFSQEGLRFVEERFGRNLDLTLTQRASSAIKRRLVCAMAIADPDGPVVAATTISTRPLHPTGQGIASLFEEDVHLFPCGMNAIYNVHRCLLHIRGNMKSISFGFPYVDTLKILQKFGPGCVFYGHGSDEDLEALEMRLRNGERFLALFCEFPGNPLLTCPNLGRIRSLADEFDFPVVVDETIGNMANINVMGFADIVVSSLTKVFSGDCNVMGGAAIFNPNGHYYSSLCAAASAVFENNYWPEDVIFMERNSRDYESRIVRINHNSEAICQALLGSAVIKRIYYPKYNDTKGNYDLCRLPNGGYGGLLSVTFHHKHQAVAFYNALNTAKGPSLGTNFTLTSPYVLLAHYNELDWVKEFGIDPDLIRVSVGLERTEELVTIFQVALSAAQISADQ
jgi:cystathionine gamma-synthase